MKNVRLFAVAAALGMFASTVAAAETKTIVKWDKESDIVRVDAGQKVLVPSVTATAVVENGTTVCQNGTDLNGDGYVDSAAYGLSPVLTSAPAGILGQTLWSSKEEAVNALTFGGALVLEPHETTYDKDAMLYVNTETSEVYTSYDEMFDALVDAKLATVAYYDDGGIDTVTISNAVYYDANEEFATGEGAYVYYSLGGRKSDEAIKEWVCRVLAGDLTDSNNNALSASSYVSMSGTRTSAEYAIRYVSQNDIDGAAPANNDKVDITYDNDNDSTTPAADIISNYDVVDGTTNRPIVFVSQDRRGDYSFTSLTAKETAISGNKPAVNAATTLIANATKQYTSHAEALKGTIVANNSTAISGAATTKTFAYEHKTAHTLHYVTASDILTDAGGSKTIETNSDNKFWAEDAKTIINAQAGVKYVISNPANVDSTSFDGSTVEFAKKATVTSANNTIYNEEYDALKNDATTLFDAVAILTQDKWGYDVETVYTPANCVMQVEVTVGANKTLKTVTPANYKDYLKGTVDKITIDGITYEFDDNDTDGYYFDTQATSYVQKLSKRAVPFTYVVYGAGAVGRSDGNAKGYTVVDLTTAQANAGVALYGAYHTETALTTNIFLAKEVENSSLAANTASPKYDSLLATAKAGYITVVDITNLSVEAYDTTKNGTADSFEYVDFEVVDQIKIPTLKGGDLLTSYELVITDDNEIKLVGTPAFENAIGAATNKVTDTPSFTYIREDIENDTDKYVLLKSRITGFTYSSAKGTGTLTAADGTTKINCKIVDLGSRSSHDYFPAFDTMEELEDAVAKIYGVENALEGKASDAASSYGRWYAKWTTGLTTAQKAAVPTSATYFNSEKSVKCSYDLEKTVTVKVDASELKNEGADNEAGVYDIKYTAVVDGKEVATETVKVVVAPKYYREYQNGRVVKCTSYYADNAKLVYSVTEYNWDAKKGTVSYFDRNGAVVNTQELILG